MDLNYLRRKDTTKGPPLRVLSLDGGGVRGYSMFIILQELMHRTFVELEGRAPKRHEIPKPCDHFDLIVGTGTGGLVAIMLGRLRMDIDTCKDVYIRTTKKVFETDKTIAGIPYRSTLFKASKLEEAIKECVREHTVYDDEGNDIAASSTLDVSPRSRGGRTSPPHRSASVASRYSQYGSTRTTLNPRSPLFAYKYGNPEAVLYDTRENRTKTALTAVFKGTPRSGSAVLLRSYDSRKEPAPEFNCKIWEAGRATCATGLAFKPIQIGQSVFIDEGAGKYNPAPQALDEAVCNEWPGRDVGVFVSLGTGKRPKGTSNQQHLWWEGFVSSGIGDFAEARRRLISKIEGCEETHLQMIKEFLPQRGVNVENYYRMNVEVGVGEFGMNEWNRLAEISTNTRMYLGKSDVQSLSHGIASKLARIEFAKARWERARHAGYDDSDSIVSSEFSGYNMASLIPPPLDPTAVELPADTDMQLSPSDARSSVIYNPHEPPPALPPKSRRRPSEEKIILTSHSGENLPIPIENFPMPPDKMLPRPPPDQNNSYRNGLHTGSASHSPNNSLGASPRVSSESYRLSGPPPLPPKTPLSELRSGGPYQPPPPPPRSKSRPSNGSGSNLPYPDTDGPPPAVNVARKPEYHAQ